MGQEASLLDGEFGPTPLDGLVAAVRRAPGRRAIRHSGSSSGHPVIAEVAARVRAALPQVHIVYGGVQDHEEEASAVPPRPRRTPIEAGRRAGL